MYYKDVTHFKNAVRKAMDKGGKQGIAEVNKNVKLDSKNEQRKRDFAKKIAKPKKNPERGHEERHWKRMQAEGDRTANDYRG
jgi:hypothetical protein